jgi:hypothetical protein
MWTVSYLLFLILVHTSEIKLEIFKCMKNLSKVTGGSKIVYSPREQIRQLWLLN